MGFERGQLFDRLWEGGGVESSSRVEYLFCEVGVSPCGCAVGRQPVMTALYRMCGGTPNLRYVQFLEDIVAGCSDHPR